MRMTAVRLSSGMLFASLVSAASLQGVITDWKCAQLMQRNGRENVLSHNKSCSLMKNFNRAAYGVITDEGKVYQIEDPGNAHVLELLKNTRDREIT